MGSFYWALVCLALLNISTAGIAADPIYVDFYFGATFEKFDPDLDVTGQTNRRNPAVKFISTQLSEAVGYAEVLGVNQPIYVHHVRLPASLVKIPMGEDTGWPSATSKYRLSHYLLQGREISSDLEFELTKGAGFFVDRVSLKTYPARVVGARFDRNGWVWVSAREDFSDYALFSKKSAGYRTKGPGCYASVLRLTLIRKR